ncbi:MAG: arylamine N-acetyltransferase family protein [Natrialbaceae archaeon]
MDTDAYLRRFGVDPSSVGDPDLDTLRHLHRKHVRTVPFENLAITGDPRGRFEAEGVDLELPALYGKIVERGRGGYCFELNGLFCWLLAELGYDARRVAARVLAEDGDPGIPANHHSIVVELDEPYVVDVGLGTPKLRRPIPIRADEPASGPVCDWLVRPSDRPEEDYCLRMRHPDDGWTGRYVFTEAARSLRYFSAANDYLQAAEDSPFTGDPYLSIATADGYVSCSGRALTTVAGGERTEQTLSEIAWYDHLDRTFGLPATDQ